MSATDLSLNNALIRGYFTGKESTPPVSELLYVHSHPGIRPNFLSQLELIINKTALHMANRNITGSPVQKFTHLTIRLGQILPGLNQENAAEALETLKQIYKLCVEVAGPQITIIEKR